MTLDELLASGWEGDPTALSDAIKEDKKERSIEQIANDAGISAVSIHNWLNGTVKKPDFKKLEAVASKLGIDVVGLMRLGRTGATLSSVEEELYWRQGLTPEPYDPLSSADEEGKHLFCQFDEYSQPLDYLWCDPDKESYIHANCITKVNPHLLQVDFNHTGEWAPNLSLFPLGQRPFVLPSGTLNLCFRAKAEKAEYSLSIEVRIRDRKLNSWIYWSNEKGDRAIHTITKEGKDIRIPLSPHIKGKWIRFPVNAPSSVSNKPDFSILTGVTLVVGRGTTSKLATLRGDGIQRGSGCLLIESLYVE